MADDQEKTEEPTDKKIEDARKEGNVPKSQDMAGIITLFFVLLASLMLSDYMFDRMSNIARYFFNKIGEPITYNNILDIAIVTMKEFLLIVLPLALVSAVSGVISNVAQIGFLYTTKPLMPDITKLNPIKGMKNLISMSKIIEGFKMTLKSLTAMSIGFMFFWFFIKELPTVTLFPMHQQLEWIHDKVIILALVMMLILFVFALIDIVIKRFEYFKKLRMSKQEIKDEMKNMDGDPHIKAKIRQIQMQAAQKRMMADIPDADVVITNPTHYAVAIKYDEQKHRSPIVLAKGKDNIALKIKSIARENNIHIVQNPPLARSLFSDVEVEHPIPEELFGAVAEVLAYVYKMNK